MELRESLLARLRELEVERRRIRRVLTALEDGTRQRPGRRPVTAEVLLARVSEAPGVRGSALALELSRPMDEIRGGLEALEAAGRIARLGLGWATAAAWSAASGHLGD